MGTTGFQFPHFGVTCQVKFSVQFTNSAKSKIFVPIFFRRTCLCLLIMCLSNSTLFFKAVNHGNLVNLTDTNQSFSRRLSGNNWSTELQASPEQKLKKKKSSENAKKKTTGGVGDKCGPTPFNVAAAHSLTMIFSNLFI